MKSGQIAAPLLALALAGCATTAPAPTLPESQLSFWSALSSHCGEAYGGALATDDARDVDFRGRAMVAHWAHCSEDRIHVAFHVEAADKSGWDRSRTWVFTRTASGLRLKHDHRHEDGSEDKVTQYGGDTAEAGTSQGQDFLVDAFSIQMFGRENLPASVTNVWRAEVDRAGTPGGRYIYQLTRRNDPTRLFRVAFDFAAPVTPPPPAWGHE